MIVKSPFCPPTLFRASAMASPGDDDVCDGIHLRVWLDATFGFPIHPFVVLPPLGEFPVTGVNFTTSSARGAPTAPFDPAEWGPVTMVLDPPGAGGFDPWLCWVRLEADPGAELRLDLLDNKGRLIGSRSEWPWAVSGSNIAQVRVAGSGEVRGLVAIDLSAPNDLSSDPPTLELSLPVERQAWYSHGLGRDVTMDRAASCAPRRFAPHDDGDQSSINDPESVERGRLEPIVPTLERLVEDTFNSSEPPSRRQLVLDPPPGTKGTSTLRSLAALLTTAADPGVARFLGLLGTIPEGLDQPDLPKIWLVGAILAVDPSDGEAWALAGLDDPPSELQNQIASYIRQHYPEVADVERDAESAGLATRAFVTVAAAALPLDPPSVPGRRPGVGSWNTSPPGTWAQDLHVDGAPPTGPIAVVRTSPDGFSLHHAIGGTSPPRRAVMIAGRDVSGAVTITDLEVPPPEATWTIWYSDEFGRWGFREEVGAVEPGRPAPVAPAVELWFAPATPSPTGLSPASAGEIRATVTVPDVSSLEPGMLPFTALNVSVDGQSLGAQFPVSAVIGIPAPPTSPGGSIEVVVTMSLENDEVVSPPNTQRLTVHDPRRPPPLVAAPAIVWTSRPDPGGGAELALSWPVQAEATAYRVYLADEQALAAGSSFAPTASRAERAKTMFTAAAGAGKERFQLVTDPPLVAKAGASMVDFSHRLPGRLTGLVFVRVVPLTDGWVEAPFLDSGLVPIAVPSTDTPPPPSLRATTGPAGKVTLEIRAAGVDKDLLARLGGGVARPPEYRLRRTGGTGQVSPVYARLVTSGSLTAGAEPGVWTASVEVAGALPFVPASWYCEVRYPSEPGVAGTPDLVLSDRSVRPTWSKPGRALDAEWSEPSLPATSFHDPGPPAPPAGARVETQAGVRSIVLDPAPVASPLAAGPFRLAVWRLVPGAEPALVIPLDQAAIRATPHRVPDPVGAPRYRLVLVDPLGRWSNAVDVTQP